MPNVRALRHTTAVLGMLALAACERHVAPTPASDLAAARARWAASGATTYVVESRIRCFCPGHLAVWTRLSIRNDRVESAEPVEPLPPGAFTSVLGWQTVPQLFETIEQRAKDDVVVGVAARYHPTLGYPEEIKVTCRSNVTDCGGTYELRNLAR